MRMLAFAGRNRKEILRDPLSFVFCLGFPVLLLIAFRFIQYNTGDSWMSSTDLVPGVAVFSLSFDLLFMVLLVTKDRQSSFLSRLYNSPMTVSDFLLGYALPCLLVGVAQLCITYLAGSLIFLIPNGGFDGGLVFVSKTVDYTVFPPAEGTARIVVPLRNLLLSVAAALPVLCFFLFCGILFGIVLNDRAAPGVSSALITAAGLLGGCWMPLDAMGGFETVCRVFPFYPAVILARAAFSGAGDTGDILLSLFTVCLWTLAVFLLSLLAFRRTRRG